MEFEKKNFYERLGVSHDATEEQIKDAYREIARVYHPDSKFFDELLEGSTRATLSDRDNQIFQLVTEAYNTLISKSRREKYDRELAAAGKWVSPGAATSATPASVSSPLQQEKKRRPRRPTFGGKVQIRLKQPQKDNEPPPVVKSVADMIKEERQKAAEQKGSGPFMGISPMKMAVVLGGAIILILVGVMFAML